MSESATPEIYISVDIETAGPYPGEFSMLSIGACTVKEPLSTFYIELKPINDKISEEALQVHRLSIERLRERGVEPAEAMQRFDAWVQGLEPKHGRPVFVAFNAAFDWMFVSYYLHKYLGRNPFGHSALDIKAYYMGLYNTLWADTSMGKLAPRYLADRTLTHHALRDALDQAEIFQKMLAESHARSLPPAP
ncbi:MAG: 3'-5' exonuclease [Anaerolineales bacterium]|nr:3'-5' exonuclease [Anaerolineales bacterium]